MSIDSLDTLLEGNGLMFEAPPESNDVVLDASLQGDGVVFDGPCDGLQEQPREDDWNISDEDAETRGRVR